MSENERCPECGSWGEECINPAPVKGCGCGRCASAELAAHKREIESLRAQVDLVRRCLLDFHNTCTCTGSDIEQVRAWAAGALNLIPKRKP